MPAAGLPELLGERAQLLADGGELLAVLPGRLAQLPDLPRGHQRLGLGLPGADRRSPPRAAGRRRGRRVAGHGVPSRSALRALAGRGRRRWWSAGRSGAAAARGRFGDVVEPAVEDGQGGAALGRGERVEGLRQVDGQLLGQVGHRGGAVLGRQPRRHLAQGAANRQPSLVVRSTGRAPRRARPGGSPPRTRRRHTSWRRPPHSVRIGPSRTPDASGAPLRGKRPHAGPVQHLGRRARAPPPTQAAAACSRTPLPPGYRRSTSGSGSSTIHSSNDSVVLRSS